MIFLVFTALLWLIALFHIWDHRRFERDLSRLTETVHLDTGGPRARSDWRPVPLPRGAESGVAFRRAFMIDTRYDALRYAVPVVFFVVLLLGLKAWFWAGFYLLAVVVKWFATTAVLHGAARRYDIYLLNKKIFSAALP